MPLLCLHLEPSILEHNVGGASQTSHISLLAKRANERALGTWAGVG